MKCGRVTRGAAECAEVGWKTVKLGDVCNRVCSGGTPRSTNSQFYDNGTIPWLNTKEIHSNRIWGTEKKITEEGLRASSAKWIRENTVIVAMYGATAGNVAQTRIPLTTNQACCNLEVNGDVAFSDYIFYSLLNSYDKLTLLANGAAQQNLNAQTIKEFPISLPPLPIQRKIAAVLGAIDDKIENNRKICANLEAQAQALFKSWFVDFEPWGGKMPKDWKMGKLGDVAEYRKGKIKSQELTEETFYSTENMIQGKQGFNPATSLPIEGEVPVCQYGDVLVSNIRPYFKKICFSWSKGGHSPDVLCFAVKNQDMRFLLYRALWDDAFFAYMMSSVKGTKMPRGDKEQLLSYDIVIPNSRDLASFNATVEPMCVKISRKVEESRALAEMRDALLPKLMSGEIDVSEVAV